ncbi:hypothetical protein MYX78_00195 [Acidobacteria bacterium AH-259-G07]|nr:hypothetical protein [Acidobacteria bacterium AH-259-G07]
MSITKKELQQILSTQTKEFKGHTDQRFGVLERNLRKELKRFADKEDFAQLRKEMRLLATKEDLNQQIEGLAAMVNRGFDDIKSQLDVRKTVREHGRKISRLERALNIKL